MRYYNIILILLAALLVFAVGAWLSVLVLPNPLSNPLSRIIPWPVACSTRGCITTFAWQRQMQMTRAFADKTGQKPQSARNTLTTLIRQHLVHFGQLRTPIDTTDAQRYRENILKITDEKTTRETMGLSLNEYDKYVITPFLEQESLRQQLELKTTDELFKKLTRERFVLALAWRTR